MTDTRKKTKLIPFMVYFKTKAEKDRMKRAAAIRQKNPNPNLTEYARIAIDEAVERDLSGEGR